MRKKLLILIFMLITFVSLNNKVKAYNEYNIGDKVTYKGQEYYVVNKSYKTDDYVTLLKVNPLTVDEVNKYGTDENGVNHINKYTYASVGTAYDQNGYGGMVYYSSTTCGGGNIEWTDKGCVNNYDLSDIKYVVDGWANDTFEEGELVEDKLGYKARLIRYEELGCAGKLNCGRDDVYKYLVNDEVPYYAYWTMTPYLYELVTSAQVHVMSSSGFPGVYNMTQANHNLVVRPVINVNKCALNPEDKGCLECENEPTYEDISLFKEYKVGDVIEYNGENYYVIENSDNNTNYVTLLKEKILTKQEILEYKGNLDIEFNSEYAEAYISYYFAKNCDYSSTNKCKSAYDNSNIKIIVDNWTKSFEKDLIEVNGYKARILSVNNLVDNLGYNISARITQNGFGKTEDVAEWVYDTKTSVWTMSPYGDTNNRIYKISWYGYIDDSYVHTTSGTVRPVINLNKCVLDGGCYEGTVPNGCLEKEKEEEQNQIEEDKNETGDRVGNANESIENPATLDKITKYIIVFVVSLIVLVALIIILRKTKFKKIK